MTSSFRSTVRAGSLAIALGLVLWGRPLRAEDAQRIAQTHLILEGGAGVSLSSQPGPAFDVTLGAGGRLRGTPVRGYALAQAGYFEAGRDETRTFGREHRRDLALGAGFRLYVALPDRLRVHLDLLGGAGWVTSELMRSGASTLREDGIYPQLIVAPGVQYRLFRELSLGARAKWVVSKTGFDELYEVAPGKKRHPWSLLVGATWHF